MKTMLMSTQPTWHFSKKIHRLSAHSLFTHPACIWLAGCRPLSSFINKKASLCDPPYSPGDKAWGPQLVSAGSQGPRLPAPTLLDGNPPAFSSTANASMLAIALRQAQTFCHKFDTAFINPHILAGNAREIPPACTCQLEVFPMTGFRPHQLNWPPKTLDGIDWRRF